jgi:hypothetical protein
LNPHPTYTESSLGAGFNFHRQVHLKSEEEEKLETQKNLKETRKNSKPKRNPKETHLQNPTGTQNPTGVDSGARFHPWVWVSVSNSIRLYFLTDRVFGQPDPNLTHCHPYLD